MSLFHLFLFGGDTKTSENICCNFIAIEDYVVTIRFYGSFHSESKIHSIHKVTILLLITNLIKYETFHLKGIQHKAASLNLSNIFNNYPIDSYSPVSLPLSLSFFFFFRGAIKTFSLQLFPLVVKSHTNDKNHDRGVAKVLWKLVVAS